MSELKHSFKPQNDSVLLKEKASGPPRLVSKHPVKIIVWWAMNAQALTDLHMVPPEAICGRRLLCH